MREKRRTVQGGRLTERWKIIGALAYPSLGAGAIIILLGGVLMFVERFQGQNFILGVELVTLGWLLWIPAALLWRHEKTPAAPS